MRIGWKYIFILYILLSQLCNIIFLNLRTTIGYGDFTPKTITEVVYVIFFMIIASFLFAYTFNSIGAIIQDMN